MAFTFNRQSPILLFPAPKFTKTVRLRSSGRLPSSPGFLAYLLIPPFFVFFVARDTREFRGVRLPKFQDGLPTFFFFGRLSFSLWISFSHPFVLSAWGSCLFVPSPFLCIPLRHLLPSACLRILKPALLIAFEALTLLFPFPSASLSSLYIPLSLAESLSSIFFSMIIIPVRSLLGVP